MDIDHFHEHIDSLNPVVESHGMIMLDLMYHLFKAYKVCRMVSLGINTHKLRVKQSMNRLALRTICRLTSWRMLFLNKFVINWMKIACGDLYLELRRRYLHWYQRWMRTERDLIQEELQPIQILILSMERRKRIRLSKILVNQIMTRLEASQSGSSIPGEPSLATPWFSMARPITGVLITMT